MQPLPRKLSLDTGVLTEYFGGTPLGHKFRKFLERDETEFFLSPNVLTELYYIGCRQKGRNYAEDIFKTIMNSGFNVVATPEYALEAGRYKCERALSIADCYVLAVAKLMDAIALFKKEKELLREIEKRPIDVGIIFIEEFPV